MMLYPSMNELLKKIPNRYSLVNVAAKRARDIAEAAEMDPDIHLTEKPVSLALADIINDKIKPVACVEGEEDAAVLEENAAEEAAVTLAE